MHRATLGRTFGAEIPRPKGRRIPAKGNALDMKSCIPPCSERTPPILHIRCDPSGIGRCVCVIPGVSVVPPSTPGYRLSSLRDVADSPAVRVIAKPEATRPCAKVDRSRRSVIEPGGFPAISRWLRSEATTPPDSDPKKTHPGGMPAKHGCCRKWGGVGTPKKGCGS